MSKELFRAWAEVNLDNLKDNLNEIKKIINPNTKIMPVVKANAYGHGVEKIIETLYENGADRFAVATLDEAIAIRNKGLNMPLQILSYTSLHRAGEIVDNNIIQTVNDIETAEVLSAEAVRRKKKVTVHIKINTGMNRLGFPCNDKTIKKIIKIYSLPFINIEGIMTHFTSSDENDSEYTYRQFERFLDIFQKIKKLGICIPIRHVSNSGAVISYPDMNLEMIRPGIILYGLYPSDNLKKSGLPLKPVMSLKANVISVNRILKNEFVGYGRRFKTLRKTFIAILPIGYADGYSRLLSNKAKVLINGEFAPVVGNICMDHCMVNVTDIGKKVSNGDEAVLFGEQNGNWIQADKLASILDTIGYEIVTGIGNRIPRVYIKSGKIDMIKNYLV